MTATVHVVAPFHSRLRKEHWSHCAFTQIALKQIEIFRRLGMHVIDYSNFGSESTAHEHVPLLDEAAFGRFFSDDGMPGHRAEIGSPGWLEWITKLTASMKARSRGPGQHIVVHTFADAAACLLNDLPEALHLESHVGYDRAPFGAKRVYVSEAWRHFMWGKYPNDVGDRRYSWVVLPYYDEEDWPFVKAPKDYVAFMGRVVNDKGISTIRAIASARPRWKFKIAGEGDPRPFDLPSNVEHAGVLPGRDRARFVGDARVLLCPTEYVEPCAGVVCETALTGTPTVASSWGGFTETIRHGETGYHAATLAEWIAGIDAATALDRRRVARAARERFSLEAAAAGYARVFEQLLSLHGKGWYAGVAPTSSVRRRADPRSHRQPLAARTSKRSGRPKRRRRPGRS